MSMEWFKHLYDGVLGITAHVSKTADSPSHETAWTIKVNAFALELTIVVNIAKGV